MMLSIFADDLRGGCDGCEGCDGCDKAGDCSLLPGGLTWGAG